MLPHEPEGSPIPPSISEFAKDVKFPRLMVTPVAMDRFALMVIVVAKVFVPLFERTKLLKRVETDPPTDCVVPLKVTVLVFAVNVPLFDQFPLTVKVFDPVMVKDAPLLMVRLRLNPPAEPMTG